MKDFFSRCGLEISSNAHLCLSVRFHCDDAICKRWDPLPFLSLSLTLSVSLPRPSITSPSSLSHVTRLLSSLYPILSDWLSSKVGCQPFLGFQEEYIVWVSRYSEESPKWLCVATQILRAAIWISWSIGFFFTWERFSMSFIVINSTTFWQ